MSIPAFPTFKLLEISDRTEIESRTKDFRPYSDFHFTILWCWDIHEPVLLSLLHNNLIVFHSDCITTKSYYSIIGCNTISNTIEELSNYINSMHCECTIKWVPEETFRMVNGYTNHFIEDTSSFDYIYDVRKLYNAVGSDLASYRRKVNHFAHNHSDVTVSFLDIRDSEVQDQLLKFFHSWMMTKNEKTKHFHSGFEIQAFRKLIHTITNFEPIHVLAVSVQSQLQAFAIIDVMNTEYACIPFIKSNHTCKYALQFLMSEVVAFLNQNQIKYINFEPDLGIPSLRASKQFYKPIAYLKKYSLETSR